MKVKDSRKADDIAIIGMACRFPGARNYEEYWDNLIAGKNCVGEIPKDRWSWEDYYGDPASDDSKTNIKYGGFIDDVDKFDPLFFKISPREAGYMDPQHRIFLESTWHAIEDAGYNPVDLSGKDIGVYAGVSKNDYAELMREQKVPIISFLSTGTVHSILANRVSWLLDFQGKSEVVDTACSSFLVALDHAVNDINNGFCEAAVVGGVNTILSPTMYISHSKSGMLSEDGQCRSFDAKANGYVRGEGVGVVFIKSLDQAISDKDNILGVIKGSSVKHGGRSNFLTAPKVSAQASTISAAIAAADINPKTISCIETHGTGTPLGDPIEINALKQAYQPYLKGDESPFCGLTSTKTNVGHLESAAGVAGLIKVLLGFKYKQIPSLLHFEALNPYIKLDGSPFYIVEEHQDWNSISLDGIEYPLRAGISSFGMGGVNAHVIVEEPPFVGRKNKSLPAGKQSKTDKKYIIPISAKTSEQLNKYVASLYEHLSRKDGRCSISDICFTLQNGREALEKRVAFLVDDYQQLLGALRDFNENKQNNPVFVGDAGKDKKPQSFSAVFDHHNTAGMAEYWATGGAVDWKNIVQYQKGNRAQLPVYPFQKRHCWFPRPEENSERLLSEKEEGSLISQTFSRSDYFIRDHIVKGVSIVPGVKCLDIFQVVGEKISREPVRVLQDIYWAKAIKVEQDVHVNVQYTQGSSDKNYNLSLVKEGEVYCTGVIITGHQKKPLHRIDIEKIRTRCQLTLEHPALYQQFIQNGLAYGDTFQSIKSCYYNKTEILCELRQSPDVTVSRDSILEPSMLDGVFQSVVALQILNAEKKREQKVPFHLKTIKIYGDVPEQCYVYSAINHKPSSDAQASFTMYLCDRQGNIIVEFLEFVKREYLPLAVSGRSSSHKTSINNEKSIMENNILYYTPQWIPRKFGMHNENTSSVIIFDTNPSLTTFLRKTGKYQRVILVRMGDKFKQTGKYTYTINHKESNSFKSLWEDFKKQGIEANALIYKWNYKINYKNVSSIAKNIDLGIKLLLTLTQSLILSKLPNRIRILYLYPAQDSVETCLHASVGGFSRTLTFENPNINITSVGLSETIPEKIAGMVSQELSFYRNTPLTEVRYVDGQRKVRLMVRYDNFSETLDKSLIKQNGTYLIAGGAGGLGHIFAQHLARNYGARLILVGRSKINDHIETKLDHLRQIGGDGQYYSVDISNETALINICQEIRADGVRLNGVLNCAGLIDDSYIIHKTGKSFDNVIAPKIMGTLNLDKATAQDQLDFFVLFSSIASIMPNQGQCDYAAANSFLDEFSSYRNHLLEKDERTGKAIAINWPLWKNGGIGVIKEEEEHLWDVFGMRALESERGVAIFDKMLSENPLLLSDQLIAIEGEQYKIEKHLNVLSGEHYSDQDNAINEISIKDKIRKIISGAGTASRDISDTENLTDYGIDSVGISKITLEINETFSLDIDPTLFFDLNTVSRVSEYLWKNYEGLLMGHSVHQQDQSAFMPERALIDIDFSDSKSLFFQKTLSDEEFFMKDHVVEGLYNVPGACYIEMALQAGSLVTQGRHVFKLSNNYWAKQLSTSGNPIRADLRLFKKDDFYEYEITHSEGGGKVLHALGQVHTKPVENIEQEPLTFINLDEITSRCTVNRKPEEIYQFIHAEGLHVGPSFQPMLKIDLNAKEALSHLKLPTFIENTYEDYVLHPSMLTGVLQTALLNNKPGGMNNSKFIPIAIDDIIVHRKIPEECYVYTEIINSTKTNNEIRKYNARVITIEGNIVVEIKGLSLRNLTHSSEQIEEQESQTENKKHRAGESSGITLEQVSELLKETLSDAIGMPPADIEADVQLESYGINSVMIVDLNRRLDALFGNLSKTLFFEYKNILELAEYFLDQHKNTLQRILGEKADTGHPHEKTAAISDVSDSPQENNAIDNDIFVNTSTTDDVVPAESTDVDEEAIAIVGMSGRYPEAGNLSEFWENLKSGRDSISKMPESRFDRKTLQKLFPDQDLLPEEWGGFLDDIDKFDPLFFNISPREAAIIDPQERMFLEVAWESIEDAGYAPKHLKGETVGVFVGALWQPYITLGVEQTFKGNLQRPHGLLYSIANRVSFFFDWCGPSMAVDTACSASLTALHLACESLKRNESHSAIVGGVNISLSSSKYLWLSNNNFLASDGKCRSFGSGGDGYVPGEGVGAVYIKRLQDAIRDGDHVYGVIKGTSINHGGKTNGYTVPNPRKQAELIASSLNKSGIFPEDISYVEAHGTGTSLGDPIEITGLKNAFSSYTDKKEFCAIGSVKSNIGHLEAAAGIAGLTKLLLQMKHKTLVPSLHSGEENPNIDFPDTPFVVQKELKAWIPKIVASSLNSDDGSQEKAIPLRGMVSSFGAGGSNAHAIIEEYHHLNNAATWSGDNNNRQNTSHESMVSRLSSGKDIIIPLSAKTTDRLRVCVSNLLKYIETNEGDILNTGDSFRSGSVRLEDIAFTLQTGREAMDERVVFLVSDIADLKMQLKIYISMESTATESISSSKMISGNIGSGRKIFNVFSLDNELNTVFDGWVASGDGLKVATLWINGIEVDWSRLYPSRKPVKISLPTYPFRKDRYWIDETEIECVTNVPSPHQLIQIHPLLHENTSDLYMQRYSTGFTGEEPYFEAPSLKGEKILSSMAYLEMVRAAIFQASGIKSRHRKTICLSDIEWLEQFSVGDQNKKLHIALTLDDDHDSNVENIHFDILSAEKDQEDQTVLHVRGCACIHHKENDEKQDVISLAGKMRSKNIFSNECDRIFESMPGFQYKGAIKAINIGDSDALVTFESGVSLENNFTENKNNTFTLHPNALSLVLSAIIGIARDKPGTLINSKLLENLLSIGSPLPVMLKKMEIYQAFSENMFAWVRNVHHPVVPVSDKGVVKLDVDFIDGNGCVCARVVGLSFEGRKEESRRDILPSVRGFTGKSPDISEKPTAISLSSLQPGYPAEPEGMSLNTENTINDERYKAPLINAINTSGLSEPQSATNHDFIQILSESLANALYMELGDVDIDRQFTEMGLDSIVGVEWVNELNRKFSLNINATIVYDYPTIKDFSCYLENKVAEPETQVDTNNDTPRETWHIQNAIISKNNALSSINDPSPIMENSSDSKTTMFLQANDLQKMLVTSLAKALYMDESDVNAESAFIDMGLDSIVGVEWVKAINDQFKTSIMATAVYDYTNLHEFSRYLERIIRNREEEKIQGVEMAD